MSVNRPAARTSSPDGKLEFEPAYSFMGDNEDYIDAVKKLNEIAPHTVGDYIRMIFMDTITANPDRHTFNFGLLRDIDTGEILSLAPNFDNNMALISRGYPRNTERKNDVLIDLFAELMEYDKSLMKYIPDVSEGAVTDVIDEMNMRVRKNTIVNFIMNGYKRIQKLCASPNG